MSEQNNSQGKSGGILLKFGIVGTAIAALCCFTPVLVVLFGAVGLAALVGYLDMVLFPAMFFFIALTAYALWRRQNGANCDTTRKNT